MSVNGKPEVDGSVAHRALEPSSDINAYDPLDRINVYPFVFGLVLVFVALEIPYRPVHLPPPLLIAGGLFSVVLFALVSLESHFLTLLILAAYLPFSKILAGDFGHLFTGFNFTNILSMLTMYGWLVRGGIHGQRVLYRSRSDLPILAFSFLAVISLLRGALSTQGLSFATVIELKRYLTPLFFFYLFASNIRSLKQFKAVVTCSIFAVVMVTVMGLKEFYIDIGPMSSYEKMRIQGICEQSNNLGAFFVYYSMMLLSYALLTKNRRHFWGLLFLFLLSARATTLTFSRGAVLSFAVTTFFLISWWSKRAGAAVLGIFLVLILVFPNHLPDSIVGRFRQNIAVDRDGIVIREDLDKSAKGRLTHWRGAIKMIQYNPLFGIGYGQYPRHAEIFADAPLGGIRDVHQGLLLIGAEMGLPALILFLIILYQFFQTGRRLYRDSDDVFIRAFGLAVMAMVVGVFMANMFGDRLNSQELSSYFWIFGGTAMAAERMLRESEALVNETERRLSDGRQTPKIERRTADIRPQTRK